MSDKKIKIIIGTDGTTSLETVGYKGKSCVDALKFAKQLGDSIDDKKKSEYFDPSPASHIVASK